MAFLVSAVTMRGPADVVAPLGGVGDGVAHVGEAAAVHEVDDELELVEDFEVGELGLVAGFDEGFEACLDEGGGAAAEDGLLAEEVGLGLFGEGGLEDSGAGAADALGVAERRGRGRCRWRPARRRRGRGRRRLR